MFHQPFSSSSAIKASSGASLPPGERQFPDCNHFWGSTADPVFNPPRTQSSRRGRARAFQEYPHPAAQSPPPLVFGRRGSRGCSPPCRSAPRSGRSHEPKGFPQTGWACGAVTQPQGSGVHRQARGGRRRTRGCGGRMGPVQGPPLPEQATPEPLAKREARNSLFLPPAERQRGCHCAGVTCSCTPTP